MTKKLQLFSVLALFTFLAKAQNVNIPDSNFLNYLLNNTEINSNNDGSIQVTEAAEFNGVLDVSNLNISDLTGIEAFGLLQGLYCFDNALTNLDMSNNLDLLFLLCDNNQLTTLNVSNNTQLNFLKCNDNNLTNLNVSNNTILNDLHCFNNQLETLDVSNNTQLASLRCNNNNITNLDTSNNTSLDLLFCNNNLITSIDVTNNPLSLTFQCYFNNITTLVTGNNSTIRSILASANPLTSLDISQNPAVEWVEVSNCGTSLIDLNLANGNNSNFVQLLANGNPELRCVFIDSEGAFDPVCCVSIDNTASFVVTEQDCQDFLSVDEFNTENFKLFPNPASSEIILEGDFILKTVTLYSILGKEVLSSSFKTVDISNLENGIYLVKIENEVGQISTKKIIKQ